MHTVNQDVLDIIVKNADQGRANRKIPAENIQALRTVVSLGCFYLNH
jgi:hypothetical protein